ncbi:uncharacterized protein ACRADG_010077 [Cochliomyia hominivorax]
MKCETEQEWEVVNEGPCTFDSAIANSECPKFCTDEYSPICAEYKGEQKEFPNKCEILRTICKTQEKWKVIKLGYCPLTSRGLSTSQLSTCPQFCTRDHKPVCAKLNNKFRTFSNKCELQRLNCESEKEWTIVHLGSCSSDLECPLFCTREYLPVCAQYESELREFPNKCELKRTNCEMDTSWEIVSLGKCSSNLDDSCPETCAEYYRPVCAVFEDVLREFSNKCDYKRTVCQTKKDWQLINEGPCPANKHFRTFCPKYCSKELNPVCGQYKGEVREFPNYCEFQRSICESKINWKLINNGPCFLKTEKPFPALAVELQPLYPSNGNIDKISQDLRQLQEEIQKTGVDWPIIHNENYQIQSPCNSEDLDPICDIFEMKQRTFNNICQLSEEIKSSGNEWTILHKGICETISTTTPVPSVKPLIRIPLLKLAKEKLVSAMESISTTTTPKTTTTTKYTKYTPISSSTTPVPEQDESLEIPNISKGYKEIVSHCGDDSYEDSEEILDDDDDDDDNFESWEDEEDEEDDYNQQYKKEVNDKDSYKIENDLKESHDHEYESEKGDNNKKYNEKKTYSHKESNPKIETPKINKYRKNLIKLIQEKIWDLFGIRKLVNSNNGKYHKKPLKDQVNTIAYSSENKENSEDCNKDNSSTSKVSSTSKISYEEKKVLAPSYAPSSQQNNQAYDKVKADKYYGENKSSDKEDCYKDNSSTSDESSTSKISYEEEKQPVSSYASSSQQNNQTYDKVKADKYYGKDKVSDKEDCNKDNSSTSKVSSTSKISYEEEKQPVSSYASSSQQNNQTYDKVKADKYYGKDKVSDKEDCNKDNSSTSKVSSTSKISYEEEKQPLYSYASSSQQNNQTYDKVKADKYYGKDKVSDKEDCNKDNSSTSDKSSTSKISYEEKKVPAPSYAPSSLQTYDKVKADKYYGEDKKSDPIYLPNSQPEIQSNKAARPQESEPKFGVYSDDAYDYIENKPSESELSATSDHCLDLAEEKSYKSNNKYQDNLHIQDGMYPSQYSHPPPENNPINSENVMDAIEALLDKSSEEEVDEGETLLRQVLTTSNSETTSSYPIYEETEDNQLNYTKREEYPSKYNSTTKRKGEIYNGVVYKAPVYDAPTYNFIYTAPNHPILPLTPNTDMLDNLNLPDSIYPLQYTHPPPENNPVNSENVIDVLEALLDKSNEEEVNEDEALLREVLTTSNIETTSPYPVYEETKDNELNDTRHEEYPSKYNSTTNRKGEIYNGVVYKAPVYDAPTYNFIYAAPNHPILPLTPDNNPFINYPQNIANPLLPVVNETNPSETVPPANLPFNPMDFLSKLAAMSSQFVAATPNLLPTPPIKEYEKNLASNQPYQQDNSNNPFILENNQLHQPLQHHFASPNSNQNPPQIHSLFQLFPSLPPQQPQELISHLTPFYVINPQKESFEQNSPSKEHSNILPPEFKNTHLPYHPFPTTLPTAFQPPVNPQQHQPSLKQPVNPQQHQPSLKQPVNPQQYQPSLKPPVLDANVPLAPVPQQPQNPPLLHYLPPNSSFNSTVFNQIVESLKTITKRS